MTLVPSFTHTIDPSQLEWQIEDIMSRNSTVLAPLPSSFLLCWNQFNVAATYGGGVLLSTRRNKCRAYYFLLLLPTSTHQAPKTTAHHEWRRSLY